MVARFVGAGSVEQSENERPVNNEASAPAAMSATGALGKVLPAVCREEAVAALLPEGRRRPGSPPGRGSLMPRRRANVAEAINVAER